MSFSFMEITLATPRSIKDSRGGWTGGGSDCRSGRWGKDQTKRGEDTMSRLEADSEPATVLSGKGQAPVGPIPR